LEKVDILQSWFFIEPDILVLLLTFLSFVLLVSFSLFRFARLVRYKAWSIGWTLFTVAGSVGILSPGIGLVPTDILTNAGMLLGSMLLIDSNQERFRKGRELLLYPFSVLIGVLLVVFGFIYQLPYGLVFGPVGVFTAYACWKMVRKIQKIAMVKRLDYYCSIGGHILWGFAAAIFPITIWISILDVVSFFFAIGLIMAGGAMLTFLIGNTTENLETQHAISQLMSSILNHDMRNYIGSLNESAEQALKSESDKEFWLDLILEITATMGRFIDEMRSINASLTRFEAISSPINLRQILEGIITRVSREYNLKPDQIILNISEAEIVMTSGIVRELFWNIIDNAFKHGSSVVKISELESGNDGLVIEIIDEAGGMSEEMYTFLNSPESLASSSAPGMGLGLILIRGLSLLCKVSLHAQERVTDSNIIGTVYTVGFERWNPQIHGALPVDEMLPPAQ
jgi:signal transduction histidine kinase